MSEVVPDELRDPLQEVIDHELDEWCEHCEKWTEPYYRSGDKLCSICDADIHEYDTRERIEVLVKRAMDELDAIRDSVEHSMRLA